MYDFLRSLRKWSGDAARERILQGTAPACIRVTGTLDLRRAQRLTNLPRVLKVVRLDISQCMNLRTLPEQLQCEELVMRGTNVENMPQIAGQVRLIDAEDCRRLQSIPPLNVDVLNLAGCTALEGLSEGLTARRLILSRCSRLAALPRSAALAARALDLSGCVSLVRLPHELGKLEALNVSGCTALNSLPDGIRVRSWIDVAHSGLRGLPWSLRSVTVRWNGVPVSDRIAFGEPDDISVAEILKEPNLSVRRALLERVGMEWLVDRAPTTILDSDHDAGGERRLLRIQFDGGEDIMCVDVRCPSTGHRYLLRVPPEMKTCQQAVAWTAGYTDPGEYHPVIET